VPLLKVNLSYKRLCANLGQSPKIADVSSSDSKEEVDYDVGNIYDREDSKEFVMKYVSDLVKQFLMKGNNSVDKKDYPLLLLGGGSGMGKSFLLDVIGLKWAKECLVNCEVKVENNYIAIPITFNATTSLVDDELKLSAESKLCLRALYFLFGTRMEFSKFVTQFSQDYTSSTDCLVMGIASSLVFGAMLEWKTRSHRTIIWCRLPLFSTITLLKIFENHLLSGNSKFQRLVSYCNRLPKGIGRLLHEAKDKSDEEFERQYSFIYLLPHFINFF